MKLYNKTMKKTQMSLQVVIMNTIIATIKVEQFVDSIPGCSHLYRMVGRQPGDSKVDDYPSAGHKRLENAVSLQQNVLSSLIFINV